MHTNADATLYNKVVVDGGEVWIRTVLRSVFWMGSKSARLKNTGHSSDDDFDVIIPFSVKAEGRTYVSIKKYQSLPDKSGYWTMQSGDKLVKGVIDFEPERISELERAFDNVLTINGVTTNDYGAVHMQHWEVAGK